jgi:hypothetical protein
VTAASFKQIRGLVAGKVNGIGPSDAKLTGYAKLPGQINLPACIVMPSVGVFYTFDTTMDRGSDDIRLTLLVLVATAVNELAQDQLDEFTPGGDYDLKTLLEGEDFGGQVNFTTVDVMQEYSLHAVSGAQYFGMQVLLTVGVEPAA